MPVEYVLLTTAGLEEMYGPQRYIHRAKAAIIEKLFRDYPTDRVLFCDSDTFFVAESDKLLSRLQPGVSLMHMREARFTQSIPQGAPPEETNGIQTAIDMIDSQAFRIGSQEHRFQKTQFMWNSGVLGLSQEVASLLPDTCALIDTLYENSRWIVSEQVGFSLALPTKTQLVPSNHYVFHYWYKPLKVLMDTLLDELLTSTFSNLNTADRLTQVRQLTTKWPHTVVLSNAREELINGFSSGAVVRGLKSAKLAVDTLPTSPFTVTFAKDLFLTLRKKDLG
ncbi:hypothetical protein GCM10011383_34170 [Hymenobacter cavernae]|uniref:Nucleotide-diphospho-sugar transferase domain-containing protein n=1 Tax=Hymenobacter cavernae TaxID=2044852 RepID=A0ABQ1UJL1_9BACT|nr:hypothetical protein GCM10011383_34170 [Hymenobacter cavernae]